MVFDFNRVPPEYEAELNHLAMMYDAMTILSFTFM
jgi:hypothetical protein